MFLIVLVIVFGAMMFWQSKKAKEQQQQQQDFRTNLQPGTEVITIGRIIGKVVEVDNQYDEIVIDSEGTKMRLALNAIAREYIRPAYVSDDEVDENGNPLPQEEIEAKSAEAQQSETADEAQETTEAEQTNNESKND
nr:preprotein translocase subunit YajC [Bifidobacterium pongonis]